MVFLMCCALGAASCAVPLGPGYVVEKQEIRVEFAPPAQFIHIEADYDLRNTGTRAIREMEILLPAGRRLHHGPATIKWDGAEITAESAPDRSRNSVLRFLQPWPVATAHSLRIAYDILPPGENADALGFAADAFYLPAAGWSPELPQIPGLFGFGGVPPKRWELVVSVPDGFLVHTSGTLQKASRQKARAQTLRALQTVADRYPFVVAGRYSASETRSAHQELILWSRASGSSGALRQARGDLARTIDIYNESFGAPPNRGKTFWIVECPVSRGCLPRFRSGDTPAGDEAPSGELVSSDTVMVDPGSGAPELAADAAPSLAASWLGYGRNPGFYVQTPPLSQLPMFAAAQAREAIRGAAVRNETILSTLRLVPEMREAKTADAPRPAPPPEDERVLRAKSLLFFYALEDRYGRQAFRNAITHMLYARAARGFDLDDLIAAFEQETHQKVAEFVRLWMKHPGVPEEFRSRYENRAGDNAAAQPASRPTFLAAATLHLQGELP
jgi:hypothetical protein